MPPTAHILKSLPTARSYNSPSIFLQVRAYTMDNRPKNPLVGLNPAVRSRAEQVVHNWKGTSASGEPTKNYIGGQFVSSSTDKWIDVLDPVCDHTSPSTSHESLTCCFGFRPPKHSLQKFRRQLIKNSMLQSQQPLRHSKRGRVPVCSPVNVSSWSWCHLLHISL